MLYLKHRRGTVLQVFARERFSGHDALMHKGARKLKGLGSHASLKLFGCEPAPIFKMRVVYLRKPAILSIFASFFQFIL